MTDTYAQLRDEVAAFARALTGLGVEQGDRVVIYMPIVPEAVVAMLACARIGAVHSVASGGFAPANSPCVSTTRPPKSSPPPAASRASGSSRTSPGRV
ncbi:AMP-binding protein [Streptomyces acidiscabies]|uniref:AMP-binding protein n=1 Tax=Streptomyces acidiscabies TaxID=42234 RepID=UPI0009522A25|nr:AMP-binding protein [Streptomyces acidiscabies]